MQQSLRRVLSLVLLLSMSLVLLSQQVDAASEWCRTDPIVRVNDVQFHLYVSAPKDYVKDVTSVLIEVRVPAGSTYRQISHSTFRGEPYIVKFVEDAALRASGQGTPIEATYTVSAPSSFPVKGEISGKEWQASKDGSANTAFSVSTTLPQ